MASPYSKFIEQLSLNEFLQIQKAYTTEKNMEKFLCGKSLFSENKNAVS